MHTVPPVSAPGAVGDGPAPSIEGATMRVEKQRVEELVIYFKTGVSSSKVGLSGEQRRDEADLILALRDYLDLL